MSDAGQLPAVLFSSGELVSGPGALVSTAEVTGMVALSPANRGDKITHIRIVCMMGMSHVGYRPLRNGIGSNYPLLHSTLTEVNRENGGG